MTVSRKKVNRLTLYNRCQHSSNNIYCCTVLYRIQLELWSYTMLELFVQGCNDGREWNTWEPAGGHKGL